MNAQRWLHQILGWLFVMLVFTGAFLHSEALRGTIADWRSVLRVLHFVFGGSFIVAFLANVPYFWTFRFGKADGLNRREYVWLLLFFGVVWLITGTGLILATMSGWTGPLTNHLYLLHIMVATIGTLCLFPHLIHAIAVRWHSRDTVREVLDEGEERTGRRSFLQFLLSGLFAGGIIVAWRWVGQRAATVKTETMEIFAQCNKMSPVPTPLPDSLPPKGGGYTGKFRVYKIDSQIPCTTSADWKFSISGLVDKPQIFRWEDFLKLPRVVQVSDFHCVEGWSVYKITYEGVRLTDLLDFAGVKPQAKYVKFYSAEGVYTESLTLEQARLPDVMAAVLIDGMQIPSDLGGPVRLVIPQMFAYKALKWFVGMELTDEQHKGYWEVRGYPVDAWVKPN